MNAWSRLPNAAHIDTILADVKARPETWAAAGGAAGGAARGAAWGAAEDAAWDAARGTARDAARGALYALIAWDESAALLDLTPDALRTIISTCEGDVKYQAALLLPAAIARGTP